MLNVIESTRFQPLLIASAVSPCVRPAPLSTVYSATDTLPVRLQTVGQFPRAGESNAVAAFDLVGGDGQAIPNDPAHEPGREEAVVAAQQEPRRHLGPRRKRPRLLKR